MTRLGPQKGPESGCCEDKSQAVQTQASRRSEEEIQGTVRTKVKLGLNATTTTKNQVVVSTIAGSSEDESNAIVRTRNRP